MSERVAVIGGGFYGCIIALELADLGRDVVLYEREDQLLQRASFVNQARIHQGYHYPRSLLTALRSRENFKAFVEEFPECVVKNFDKYYAIARKFSKVSPRQFLEFCLRIGAPIEVADQSIKDLFEPSLVAEVFKVVEFAFDASLLKEIVVDRLNRSSVSVRCSTTVSQIESSSLRFTLESVSQSRTQVETFSRVFNCTYSAINHLLQAASLTRLPLKHEHVEMALVTIPPELKGLAVTMMDGPFFSIMPFPAKNLYSLSHVRYTPHYQWLDDPDAPLVDSFQQYTSVHPDSKHRHMILDSSRYLPSLARAQYQESVWEIKTILPQSEGDDSRPILFQEHPQAQGFYSVMGGKIDNTADMREQVRALCRGDR